MEKIKCKICTREYSIKGIGTHIWRSHGNGKMHVSPRKPGFKAWNKGLTKENDTRVKLNAESVSNTIKNKVLNGTYVPNRMSLEARRNLSTSQSLHNRGGKSKWYKVNNQLVQGKWERDLAILMTELSIDWFKPKTNNDIFNYKLNNKIKSYTPDFYLKEYGIFLEIKGYWWGDDRNKMNLVLEQNVILKDNLKIIEKELFKQLLISKNKESFLNTLNMWR